MHVYVRDRIGGTTTLVSVADDDVTEGNGPSGAAGGRQVAISADGSVVAFESDATLDGRIGPYPAEALQRELDRDGMGTQRVLQTVFETYRVDVDEAGAWVAFTMGIRSAEGNA